MRWLATITLCILLSTLAGCIHHLDVQQGNVISPKAVQQLKVGMTRTQVESLLGSPVLVQSFSDQATYIYSWQSDETPFHEHSLALHFANGRLMNYSLTHYPSNHK